MQPFVFALLFAVGAQAPPPPRPTAFACTAQALFEERGCTFEGRSASAPASREAARENLKRAAVLGEELCLRFSRADAQDADPAVLAACRARVAPSTRRCAGDGSLPLVDEQGRFNPAFARCYSGLAELVRAVAADAEMAASCCACASACGLSARQCLERWDEGELGACAAERCREECAVSLLLQRAHAATATTRKP